jgi:NADH:ubiquinone oxidoreductase subunit 5 (subunit L)/multisubunit Na+/H+ antiporter MnhA subunit
VLSAFGGWLNLPDLSRLGPSACSSTGSSPSSDPRRRQSPVPEAAHSITTEFALIGAAVAIAVLGILIAVVRLKPARLVPKAQAPKEQGIERVLRDKYYVDELYDRTIVSRPCGRPRNVLATGVDQGIIDKLLVTWVGRVSPACSGGSVRDFSPARSARTRGFS